MGLTGTKKAPERLKFKVGSCASNNEANVASLEGPLGVCHVPEEFDRLRAPAVNTWASYIVRLARGTLSLPSCRASLLEDLSACFNISVVIYACKQSGTYRVYMFYRQPRISLRKSQSVSLRQPVLRSSHSCAKLNSLMIFFAINYN